MRNFVGLVGRDVIGLVFLWAGITKLSKPRRFGQALRSFPISRLIFRGPRAGLIGAVFLGMLEMLSGSFAMVGLFAEPSLLLIALMLLMFAAIMGLALARGESITCACFGSASPVTWMTVGRNLFLVALVALAYSASATPFRGVLLPAQAGSSALVAYVVAIQLMALFAVVRAFLRIRSLPNFVTHVPKFHSSSLGLVFEGVPVTQGTIRQERH